MIDEAENNPTELFLRVIVLLQLLNTSGDQKGPSRMEPCAESPPRNAGSSPLGDLALVLVRQQSNAPNVAEAFAVWDHIPGCSLSASA